MKINELKVGDLIKIRTNFNQYTEQVKIEKIDGDYFYYLKFTRYWYKIHKNHVICKLEEVKTYKEIPIEKPKSFKFDIKISEFSSDFGKYGRNWVAFGGYLGDNGRFNIELNTLDLTGFDLQKKYTLEIKEKE